MASLVTPIVGQTVTAEMWAQITELLSGLRNIPVALTGINDPSAYGLTVKNAGTGSKAFIVYAADGTTVLLQADANGVRASGDGTAASLIVNQGGKLHGSQAAGDLFYASSASALGRLAIGSNGGILYIASGVPAWLAPGSNGQVLTLSSGAPAWAAAPVAIQDRISATTDVVNTTTETNAYSYSVPGGTLGTTGVLRLIVTGDHLNNSGGGLSLTVRAKYGGVLLGSFSVSPVSNASRHSMNLEVVLSAAGATNTQVARFNLGFDSAGSAGAPPGAPSGASRYDNTNNAVGVDSTASQSLVVTFQHSGANAATSARLLAATLERM